MERKESRQLVMKSTTAPAVISSINVFCEILNSFREVSNIKQIPNRLDEAFNICGDFSLNELIPGHIHKDITLS